MYNMVSPKAYMLKACSLLGVGWVGVHRTSKIPLSTKKKKKKKIRKLLFASKASLKNLKLYVLLDRKIDQISGKGHL